MPNEPPAQVGHTEHPTAIPKKLAEEARQTLAPAATDQLDSPEARTASRESEPGGEGAASFAQHVHTYITQYITLADQKAAFVFALCAAILGYFFKSGFHSMWLKPVATWTIADPICCIAMLGLAAGALFACAVILPKLRKSHRGIVFFCSIAEHESSTEYASEVLATAPVHLARAILRHNYDLAHVCRAKYWKLTVSLWCTAFGVMLGMIVMLLK